MSGFRDSTIWVDAVAYGKTSEVVSKYVEKGKQVIVTGRLNVRNWEGKDGAKRTTVEIEVSNITFVGAPGQKNETEEEDAW